MHRRFRSFISWEPQTFSYPDDGAGGGGAGAGGGGGSADGWKPPATEAEFKAMVAPLLDQEFGKGKRLGSEGAALAKQERERLATLEKDAADRAKADADRKAKELADRGDFEKAREQIINSARDEERKAWEPKLTETQKEIERLRGRFSGLVRDKIIAVASTSNAYSPAQVADLLEGRRVRLNADLEPEVLDEQGQPALVGGRPMTLAQLVEGYLGANPNLVKSAGGQGGGAGGGASLKGEDANAEVAKLEAEVKNASEMYAKTKDNKFLSVHRNASKALAEVKDKLKAAS